MRRSSEARTEAKLARLREAKLAGLGFQLDLIGKELDREVASFDSRLASMASRAGVLVAAAGVLGAVQVTDTSSPALIWKLAFSFLAAAVGILVTFPVRRRTLDMEKVRSAVLELGPRTAQHELIRRKSGYLAQNEKTLTWRGWAVVVGYAFLTLSVVFSLLVAMTPGDSSQSKTAAVIKSISEER